MFFSHSNIPIYTKFLTKRWRAGVIKYICPPKGNIIPGCPSPWNNRRFPPSTGSSGGGIKRIMSIAFLSASEMTNLIRTYSKYEWKFYFHNSYSLKSRGKLTKIATPQNWVPHTIRIWNNCTPIFPWPWPRNVRLVWGCDPAERQHSPTEAQALLMAGTTSRAPCNFQTTSTQTYTNATFISNDSKLENMVVYRPCIFEAHTLREDARLISTAPPWHSQNACTRRWSSPSPVPTLDHQTQPGSAFALEGESKSAPNQSPQHMTMLGNLQPYQWRSEAIKVLTLRRWQLTFNDDTQWLWQCLHTWCQLTQVETKPSRQNTCSLN